MLLQDLLFLVLFLHKDLLFYKQIILNNGLPFKAQLPSNKPLNISEMTEDQFNQEMEKAYQSIQRGEGVPVEEAFAKIKRAR